MDFSFLSHTDFFRGIPPESIEERLSCLGAVQKSYDKGSYIHMAGDVVRTVSIVLSGQVLIESIDFWGSRTLIGQAGPGDLFAEAYACTDGEPLLVNVLAAQPTSILMLDIHKVLTICPQACPHHQALAENLLRIPFDRQQLADYLGVDRSALSAELSKMHRKGLIDYRKNEFHLLKDPEET